MQIAILGAGAVGSFLGACLARSGHRVTLVDRRFRPVPDASILELDEPSGVRLGVPVARVLIDNDGSGADLSGVDLAVLAAKMFDLPEASGPLAAYPELPALTVQNGVGAEELVAARRPGSPLVAASLTAAIAIGDAGEVRWLRRGGIGLSGLGGDTAALLDELAGSLTAAGLPATIFPDAPAMKWSKLLVNLVGNATSALLDMDPADIYADSALFRVERRQLLETLDVMDALDLRPVALPGANARLLARGLRLPEALTRPILARVVAGGRGGKMPSLRLHLRSGGGPTEVRWLNGAVAGAAQRLGRPAAINERLCGLVEEAASDPERRAWFRSRPDRLLAACATP